jgi:hypothetical protein
MPFRFHWYFLPSFSLFSLIIFIAFFEGFQLPALCAFLLFAIFHFRHFTPDGFLQLSFAIDYWLSLFYYFSCLFWRLFARLPDYYFHYAISLSITPLFSMILFTAILSAIFASWALQPFRFLRISLAGFHYIYAFITLLLAFISYLFILFSFDAIIFFHIIADIIFTLLLFSLFLSLIFHFIFFFTLTPLFFFFYFFFFFFFLFFFFFFFFFFFHFFFFAVDFRLPLLHWYFIISFSFTLFLSPFRHYFSFRSWLIFSPLILPFSFFRHYFLDNISFSFLHFLHCLYFAFASCAAFHFDADTAELISPPADIFTLFDSAMIRYFAFADDFRAFIISPRQLFLRFAAAAAAFRYAVAALTHFHIVIDIHYYWLFSLCHDYAIWFHFFDIDFIFIDISNIFIIISFLPLIIFFAHFAISLIFHWLLSIFHFDAIIYYYLAISWHYCHFIAISLRHYAIIDFSLFSRLFSFLSWYYRFRRFDFLFRFYDSSIDFLRAFIIAAFSLSAYAILMPFLSLSCLFSLRHISFIITISDISPFYFHTFHYFNIFIDISLSL